MDKAEGSEAQSHLKRIAFDPRDERALGRLQLEIALARLVRRQEVAAISYLPEVKQLLVVFKDIASTAGKDVQSLPPQIAEAPPPRRAG